MHLQLTVILYVHDKGKISITAKSMQLFKATRFDHRRHALVGILIGHCPLEVKRQIVGYLDGGTKLDLHDGVLATEGVFGIVNPPKLIDEFRGVSFMEFARDNSGCFWMDHIGPV